MIEEVGGLDPTLGKVKIPAHAHGRNLFPTTWACLAGGRPLTVLTIALPIATWLGDLADVDLRVEVGSKLVTVIACVAVEDVDGVDGVEQLLLRVSAEDIGHPRVKARAEQRHEARFFKAFAVGP